LLRFFFTALFICNFFAAPAQPMQQFLFTHLGTRDGLASDEIMGVQQDEKGYIWIGTMDGLQRYDSKRLLTFRNSAGNSNSIPNDMIRQVQLDKKNRLWICCNENKVGWFDVSNFSFHEIGVRFPKHLVEKAAGRLFTDEKGDIILLLSGFAVLTFDELTNEFTEQRNSFLLPKGWKANWISQDQLHHNYWIACDSGLVKFNPGNKTLSYRGNNADNDEFIAAFAHLKWVNTPYFDRYGRCWLLSWPRKDQTYFYSYDAPAKQMKEWKSQITKALGNAYYYVLTLKEQKDGTLWLIGGKLFARLNKERTAFDIIKDNLPGEFSIRYDDVKQLYEDRENNLWTCTNNGLYRFNPSAQYFHKILNKRLNKDSIYGSDVTDIVQIKNGKILVSTWGNGIFAYDKNFNPVNESFVNQSRQMGEALIWCIHQRSNGDIWRGNQFGRIFITYAASGRTEKIKPAVFEDWSIRQITEDINGNLWLATTHGNLVKWTAATNSFSLVRKFEVIIERLYADKKGYLWVCTRGSGLFKINSATGGLVENYTSGGPEGRRLMKSYAIDIITYNDSLYMIASGGINILNSRTNRITYLVNGNEFPVNYISNIIMDSLGKVWATSLGGLSSIDLDRHISSSYDQRDGVHTNFFNNASTARLDDGRIAIGTSHDLLVFNPAEIHNSGLAVPNIHITGFSVMNKDLMVDSLMNLKAIELQHDKNSITVEFSTLTYQNNYAVSYMLEGLDKTWRSGYGTNQAIYTYLPPANYVFKVKVENGDGPGNVKFASIKIKIKPPFWKTWWFVSLFAFAAIGIIFWLDKFRVARIRETERVRTRIATSLTKDMTNTLSNINVLSELAKVKLDRDVERTRDYIEQISESSNRMMEVMDDMIWSINPENDELQYTIVRMKKYAAAIQTKYDLEVSFTIDKRVNDLKLQMDYRHELFLIFKEALLNTGKHARSKFADVDIRLEKSKLKMSISDNGNGFKTGAPNFGRGLSDMRKKAAAINATLLVRSTENAGTEVILEMNLY
jgi:signal transduction histidine kinase/ligand-binding sensor domain-containing protein